MFKFSSTRWLPTVVSLCLLSACGGGGESGNSSSQSVTPPIYQLSGGGVKGPLKNAKVSLYNYDRSKSTGYGELISVGKTDELTKIKGLEITGSLENYYILSFESTDETIDISTQTSPIIVKFDTIISSSDILSGKSIYASPLSSLALALVQKKVSSGETVDQAMSQSDLLIKSIFGLSIDVSVFSSPSLLIASANTYEEQLDIYQLRKSIEVFSIFSTQLKVTLNNADLSMDNIFNSIANDILDGKLDAISTNSEQLLYSSSQLNIFEQSINNLVLPNTNNAKISSLNMLLIDEATLLHSELLNTEKLRTELSLNNQKQIALVVDHDNDGLANAEDFDDDNDGFEDVADIFPYDMYEWVDTDFDGIGNNTDKDDDNDGVIDEEDAFPLDSKESEDFDGDGLGNNVDLDDDGDNVEDINDVFPFDTSESVDTDNDGLGNNKDTDDDNDEILDVDDVFPLDKTEHLDSDNDGLGNNKDLDDDNDGVFDTVDDFPFDASESVDTDGDGLGNKKDTDDDNDGVADGLDVFPLDASEHLDTDEDGTGNNADPDDDNDGVIDEEDFLPLDPSENGDNDSDGLGNNTDPDDDNDGISDEEDAFPFDPLESVDTDLDGIGNNADPDDDNDNFLDEDDVFPYDQNEWVDTDGDGIGNNADSDDDNDGVYDNDDDLPLDPTESIDFDKDMIGDIADPDDDNDGINDNTDYIHVAVPTQSQFDPKEFINFNIRGFYTDGSILSRNEKWHIQYQVFDVNMSGLEIPFYTENGYYNASFNSAKNEWNVSFPVPEYSGDFEVKFILYCSASQDNCGDHNKINNHFRKVQSYLFQVRCIEEPCGYQPTPEPGTNVSASKIFNFLVSSVVKKNGDIIAVYTDLEEDNWKSYVTKSSNNGYSWSRVGQLPKYILNGYSIVLSQNEEILLIDKCDSSICLYSSTNTINWQSQDLLQTSNFGNCNVKKCDINFMNVADIVETTDGALMVFYYINSEGKQLIYMTKSHDRINWSTPVNILGTDNISILFSAIKMDDQGYAAVVHTRENNKNSLSISDDGQKWTEIQSFSYMSNADLIYQNGILRLFYQKDNKIYEVHSSDIINFSTPQEIVEKTYDGFAAVPLNNGEFGVLYNLYLNFQRDVFYQNVILTTP